MFKHIATHPHLDRQCDILEFHHPSGLRHFHMTTSFPEMSFALALKTPPQDDTGMPHILEHLTLCGSHKYPIKDPFQAIQQKTVAHDLNAATYPLNTVYHFATTVPRDFAHLSDLYADLVFNPLLRKEDFEQEGWRLENSKTGPVMKGVVLNEMKGAYGSQGFDHYIGMRSLLAPETALGYSYGGHPNAIPGLTFENIKAFHAEKYHPQNAVLVTTGDVPLEDLHRIMDETLNRFKSRPTKSFVSPPEAFSPPSIEKDDTGVHRIEGFGVDPETRLVRWAFKAEGPKDAREDLFDQMMHHVLLARSGNPVEELGLKYGLSTSVHYLYEGLMEMNREVGLQVNLAIPKDRLDELPAIEKDILDIMLNLKDISISEEEWQTSLDVFRRPIEASLDDTASDEAINFAQSVLWDFAIDRNTQNAALLKTMPLPTREEIAAWAARFSKEPLVAMNIQNPDMTKEWGAKEKRRLHQLLIQEHPISDPRPVEEASDVSGDLLPCLTQEEASFLKKSVLAEEKGPSSGQLSHTHITTPSRTCSVQVFVDIADVFSAEEYQKFIVLSKMLPKLAAGNTPAKEALASLEKDGLSLSVATGPMKLPDYKTGLNMVITAKCLLEDGPKIAENLLPRLHDVPVYEEKQWRKIFGASKRAWAQGASDRMKTLAKLSSIAPFSAVDSMVYDVLKESVSSRAALLASYETDPSLAHRDFCTFWERIQSCPRHVVSAGPDIVKDFALPLLKSTRSSMQSMTDFKPVTTAFKAERNFAHFEGNQAVNFCYRAYPGPLRGTMDSAIVKVACILLEQPLHDAVRARGGAYGSGISQQDGIISMSSFRDPHVEETFKAFDSVPDWLSTLVQKKDTDALHEAKLSIIAGLLHPQTPMEQAEEKKADIFMGTGDDFRQDMAKKIWAVSWDDIQEASHWFRPDPSFIADRASVPSQNHGLENAIQANKKHRS